MTTRKCRTRFNRNAVALGYAIGCSTITLLWQILEWRQG